jgi:integrase
MHRTTTTIRKKTLSDKAAAALTPKEKRYNFPDPEQRGHFIRIQPGGTKSFAAVARDPVRKRQIWAHLGEVGVLPIDEARALARAAIKRIRDGLPPFEAPQQQPDTFAAVSEEWLKRYVRKKGLRSEHEISRLLQAHILPRWKNYELVHIKRSDVARLLDEIEDDHGTRQADYVLAIIRGIMNWFATRHDDYRPPIVKGMRRRSAVEQARERVLTDAEIVRVWALAETVGSFGAFVRIALLVGQRRAKLASMRWSDLKDGAWHIPKAEREKGNAGILPLPPIALAIIETQPRIDGNPFVFAGRGDKAVNGFSKLKKQFDAPLSEVAPWTIHDLRRTHRSLLSRAGVSSKVAEHVLGHVVADIEGVYDRHKYTEEKGAALVRLTTLIDGIVNDRPNVVTIGAERRRKSA